MKATKVSAFRERGLRSGCRAEPIRCDPKFKPAIERKTDPMKTYILRDPNAVEPQKAQFVPAADPPASVIPVRVLFLGLDVHNDSIAVSLAPSDTTKCVGTD